MNRVSFSLCEGERLAILGHNGSGKSTLVKILGALIDAAEGEYIIDGKNILDWDLQEFRKTVGVVFQDPESQLIAALVEDDVAFSPENQGLDSREIQERVDMALEQVAMSHKRASPVSALSGGEKQRVAIAGALAAKVKILILDEATAMIDPDGRREIEKILRDLHKSGTSIIQVTHQIEPENFSDIDRVIILSNGEIIWESSTQDFFTNAANLGFEIPSDKPEFNTNRKTSNKNFFAIKNLSFKFENENVFALENVNLDIKSGLWLSIIGKTGSGKSTLIQHLNGLYKIQSGEIIHNGKNLPVKGSELQKLRQNVGLVFQNPESQIFAQTVHDEIAFAPMNAGYDSQELEQKIIHALRAVGLPDEFLERNPIMLSGGEKRLVAIASILSVEPECLILDEPLAGLDSVYQKRILNLLSNLRTAGHTIITVTHDLRMAAKYSDEIFDINSRVKS